MPRAITLATALPADSMVGKARHHAAGELRFGTSLTVTSVVMASIPSLPITTANRSIPGASSASEAEFRPARPRR